MSSVCAIIVTRNRVDLLREAINSLQSQTLPIQALIVIDNESADRTPEFLESLRCPFEIITIRQSNLGGAGGFERGLKEFYQRSENWAWLMDDDGRPDPTALQHLRPEDNSPPYWRNSLVLDQDNPDRLAFGFSHNGKSIRTLNEAASAMPPITACNPFNGTLLHKLLIKEIGFPIGNLFIKGDEKEYLERARRTGFATQTYIHSFFYHPAIREPDIAEVADDRVWVYYYKIRNYRAIGNKDGTIKLNFRASFSMGAACIKSILRAYVKSKKISTLSAGKRILIVACAVSASALNSTANLFVPR